MLSHAAVILGLGWEGRQRRAETLIRKVIPSVFQSEKEPHGEWSLPGNEAHSLISQLHYMTLLLGSTGLERFLTQQICQPASEPGSRALRGMVWHGHSQRGTASTAMVLNIKRCGSSCVRATRSREGCFQRVRVCVRVCVWSCWCVHPNEVPGGKAILSS